MVHAHTTRVLDEWTRRRGPARRPPARTELSPVLFGPLLPQMFILADHGAEGWRFRVAGSRLEALHGRALTGAPFLDLWSAGERPRLIRLLDAVRSEAAPKVLACRAEAERGGVLALELTLAPLIGPTDEADRMLGLHQPLSRLANLEGRPVGPLSLVSTGPAASLRLVIDNTRRAPLG